MSNTMLSPEIPMHEHLAHSAGSVLTYEESGTSSRRAHSHNGYSCRLPARRATSRASPTPRCARSEWTEVQHWVDDDPRDSAALTGRFRRPRRTVGLEERSPDRRPRVLRARRSAAGPPDAWGRRRAGQARQTPLGLEESRPFNRLDLWSKASPAQRSAVPDRVHDGTDGKDGRRGARRIGCPSG